LWFIHDFVDIYWFHSCDSRFSALFGFNSDVEAFHRIIEGEFYDVGKYRSRAQLLRRSATYMLYFNRMRKNRYKNNPAPAEIFGKLRPTIQVKQFFQFQPLILDQCLNQMAGLNHPNANKGCIL